MQPGSVRFSEHEHEHEHEFDVMDTGDLRGVTKFLANAATLFDS